MPKISALPQETEITSNDKIAFVNSDATPQRTHYITLADFVSSVFGTGTASGWNTLNAGVAPTVASGYNKGNKEYDLTFSNVNLALSLSPGMRMKLDRATTAPTQCTDLELSSSQYWSKTSPTGLSFTDDFTCEAWIKLESYGSRMGIVARRNADTEGFSFHIEQSGRVELLGLRVAGNNRYISSYQCIPLGRWVHVAATLDMSGNTGTVYIDGVSVPTIMTTNGTATALVQGTTALVVGAEKSAGTNPFDGKIADVRVWSAIRTATEIRDNMNQQLVGNETNLVAYFKFNGDANDSTANANNLSASGSATATNVDNPMKATEYAIITKVTYSAPDTTVTVFTGTDHNIPNTTLENPFYSTQKTPLNFPSTRAKWRVESSVRWAYTGISIGSTGSWVASNHKLSVPTGSWRYGYKGSYNFASTVSGLRDANITLAPSGTLTNGTLSHELAVWIYRNSTSDAPDHAYKDSYVDLTSQTEYIQYGQITSSSGSESWQIRGDKGETTIFAECAYI